jgi:hypothetical protein
MSPFFGLFASFLLALSQFDCEGIFAQRPLIIFDFVWIEDFVIITHFHIF